MSNSRVVSIRVEESTVVERSDLVDDEKEGRYTVEPIFPVDSNYVNLWANGSVTTVDSTDG